MIVRRTSQSLAVWLGAAAVGHVVAGGRDPWTFEQPNVCRTDKPIEALNVPAGNKAPSPRPPGNHDSATEKVPGPLKPPPHARRGAEAQVGLKPVLVPP
jgi:hypothetical protein